ncbi:MAG: polysaccharide deacetylase family protein [Candidatus Gottesmanbacteria bacterium]|nr:polysaccharide deacetylase family protein [Candidatus Gottesmanbacteria bacterium]
MKNNVAMIVGMIGVSFVIVVGGFVYRNSIKTILVKPDEITTISKIEQTTATASAQIEQTATQSSAIIPSPTPGIVLPPIAPNERSVRVPILLYHYISDNPNKDDKARDGLSTPPSIFKSQLDTLKSAGYTTVTFDELAAFFDGTSSLPSKPVILTFDDGYSDFYFNAYPILAGAGMKGVAFISTGLIGGGAYMTWSQVEEIARSPFVVVAAHSMHHYVLTKSNTAILKNELEESKKILQQHAPYPINWMAYPYGSFDERVVLAVRDAGYVGAATTMPGTYQYKSRLFHMPRLRAGRRTGEGLLRLIE